MTITFVAAGATSSPGTSTTAVGPTCQAGDLLVAALGVKNSSDVITTPAGWTLAVRSSTSPSAAFYTKVATAADSGASFTFSCTSGSSMTGAVLAYRGAGGVDAVAAATATTGGSPVPAPTVTTTKANEVVLELFVVTTRFGSSSVNSPPATVRTDGASAAGGFVALAVSDQAQATAGASTAQSAGMFGASTTSAAVTMSLYPTTTSYGHVVVGGAKKNVAAASVIVGGVKKPVTAMSVIVGGVKKPLA